MQTFLPYPEFDKSAHCLDDKRLGKQRVECLQLVNCLRGETTGWRNHPAAVMWENNIDALILYGMVICEEWLTRGYSDTIWAKLIRLQEIENPDMPLWLGSPKLHASHRSNLLRKRPDFYSMFRWKEPPTLEYFWPDPSYNWRLHEKIL